MPAVERGLATAGRARDRFAITCPVFVVTGRDEETTQGSRDAVRKQIAFYGSTPAYRGVLDMHGWGELQPELTVLSKRGEWDEMATLITDEILETFAILAPPNEVAQRLRERFGDLLDRVACTFGVGNQEDQRAQVKALQG